MKYGMYFIIMVLLCISCEHRLDDNKRGIFKAQVVDVNGTALAGTEVIVVSSSRPFDDFNTYGFNKFSQSDESFTLGRGITDANGAASFIILINGDKTTSVILNYDKHHNKELILDDAVYSGSLEYDISQIEVKPSAVATINYDNISGIMEPLGIRFFYESENCTQVRGSLNPAVFDCERFFSTSFNEDVVSEPLSIKTVYPSTIRVEFSDFNGGTMTTAQFTVRNPTENYVLQF